MAKLICATYGDALFELAVEENKVDVLYEEAQTVLDSLDANPELMKFLNYPKIDTAKKQQTIEDIYGKFLSKDMTGFLGIIVEKGRQNSIAGIMDYFRDRVKEYKKIGVAYVTSAKKLTDTQKKEILERLLATTEYVSFEMNYDVDESLIGGLVIRIGDRVVDSSIKTKLFELKRNLVKIQLS
jgi:F-type H+-transporting ATPase subunit delta